MNSTDKQTAAVSAPYSFDVQQQGDTHVFSYKRSRYGFQVLFGLCVIIGIPLWLFFFSLLKSSETPDIGFKPLFWALFFVFCIYLLMNRRRKGSFAISKTHISVGGRNYDRGHILKLFIREPNSPDDPAHAMAAVLYEVISQASKSNHSICFTYGERRVKLAGGLSRTAAETMLAKIKQTLNPNSKSHFYL